MSYFNELDPKPDNFLRNMIAVLAVLAAFLLAASVKGCAHTADWDPEAFEKVQVKHEGEEKRVWAPKEKCEPFQVLPGNGPSFACCFKSTGKCYTLPLFLEIDPDQVDDKR